MDKYLCERCGKELVFRCAYSKIDHKLICVECDDKEQPKELMKKIQELEVKLAEKDQTIEGLQEINQSLGQTCNNDAKEIERLREQLAEKDELLKQKIGDMKSTDFIRMCVDCGFMVQAKEIDNQTAIAELNNILDTFAIFVNEEKESMVSLDGNGNLSLLEYIENRIDTLKGEK